MKFYKIQSRLQDSGWSDYSDKFVEEHAAKKELKRLRKIKPTPVFNMMFRLIMVQISETYEVIKL